MRHVTVITWVLKEEYELYRGTLDHRKIRLFSSLFGENLLHRDMIDPVFNSGNDRIIVGVGYQRINNKHDIDNNLKVSGTTGFITNPLAGCPIALPQGGWRRIGMPLDKQAWERFKEQYFENEEEE